MEKMAVVKIVTDGARTEHGRRTDGKLFSKILIQKSPSKRHPAAGDQFRAFCISGPKVLPFIWSRPWTNRRRTDWLTDRRAPALWKGPVKMCQNSPTTSQNYKKIKILCKINKNARFTHYTPTLRVQSKKKLRKWPTNVMQCPGYLECMQLSGAQRNTVQSSKCRAV
jgi:hypothetical protein